MALRFEQIRRQQEDHIREYGFSILSIFGDESSPPFVYTLGLADVDWPELIILGTQQGILASLAVTELRKSERIPVASVTLQKTATVPVYLGSVTEANVERYLCQAVTRRRSRGLPDPAALQLVFPDREGRYPLEEGYDSKFMDTRQPCLAPGGVWDYKVT